MKASRRERKIDTNFILTFIIIFVSNDTLLFGTNANRAFFWLHVGILVVTFIYIFLHTHSINQQVIMFSLFLIIMMIITLIINFDTEYIKYIYNVFVILLCATFCKCVNRQKFSEAFVIIMYYISIFTILLFFVWMLAAPIVRFFPTITNESGIRYYFFGLGFLEDLNYGSLPRMYGIFREPGVFTCFLIMSLIIQLYIMGKLDIKRVCVISLATILTFSTAAYILVVLVLGGYFFRQILSRKYKHRKVWLLFLILAVLLTSIIYIIGSEQVMAAVFNKLKVENSSRDSRFGSIAANCRMFLKNPIFGKGWRYVEDNFIYFAKQGEFKGLHNTNTFLKFLALYGVAPFVGISAAMLTFFRKACKSLPIGIFVTVMWFITLSNEDMTVNILFYLLPFYAFDKYCEVEELTCENPVN